jgi:hypothetical protein
MESDTDTSELISDVHLRFLENWMRVDEERRRKVSEAFLRERQQGRPL